MLNLLEDYIWRSLPEWGDFSTNPNLPKKVDEAGNLLDFVGNTVVFLLDEKTKDALAELQESLYYWGSEMLAQPLERSTFHMTLHDLANGKPGQEGLEAWMAHTREGAQALISQWKNQPPLRMKATWLFNMVSTSIVLGLAPADGDSWERLDRMYTALEDVVPLGYALTPHITMGYFRPGTYCMEQVIALRNALRPVELEIELTMENLVLQNFYTMNHYEIIG